MLLDERDSSPGVKLADADLIGIPHRLVVSARGLKKNTVEYKHRRASAAENIGVAEPAETLLKLLGS
ncbi:His/Gly/Thr/Pro-type tRNA ligase C-terminal domain-containing protein [Candidatus Foliamicus sp.]